MRPIAPIDLGDTVPADLKEQDGPDFDLVVPTDLIVDGAYQRNMSPKSRQLILRIVAQWSWAKFKPPVCARVDGKLHVIDGQHTAISAASHGGIAIIPVIVVAAPDFVDRARAFISHASDRTPVTAGQIWHAAVAAGDEDALAVRNLCLRASLELLPFAPERSVYRPRQTVALKTIKQLLTKRGADGALMVLRAASDGDFAPVLAEHLKVADALLHGDDYAGEFDAEAVTAMLKSITPKTYMDARELSIAKQLPTWRALTAVLYRGRKARPRAAVAAEKPSQVEPVSAQLVTKPPPARPPTFTSVLPAPSGPDRRHIVPMVGEPEPGRSALDQRREASR